MAESSEPIRTLVKKEAAPQRDPIVSRSTSAILLVCTLLLMVSVVWALYDEAYGQRPWRSVQREFTRRYTAYLKSIRKDAGKSEAEVRETPEYQQLAEEAKAAIDKVKAEIGDRDKQVSAIQAKLDAVTEPFQNQRGRIVVITYKLETAPSDFWRKLYHNQLDTKKKEIVTVDMPGDSGKLERKKMDFAALEESFNGLREQKAKILGEKAELLKEPTELSKKRDDYLKNHVSILPQKSIDDLIKKNENAFDYTILGHQISVNQYAIVDRCEVCHLGAREPLAIKASDMAPGADALNLGKDLFYQRGCVGCHRMESFDREADALTNARQQITQLQDQIEANERQAKQDEAANTEDDAELQRLKAHAESLRITNSQLAARVDELNLQTRYLQQDQKKV